MAIGFRTSLFGFNRKDVIEFIEKSHQNFENSQNSLSLKAENLQSSLDDTMIELEKLNQEKRQLDGQIDSYSEKNAEIDRLSKEIGKLYIVARSNAKTVVECTRNNAQIVNEQIKNNLNVIEQTNEALVLLRENIVKTTESFVEDVDRMISSLDSIKTKFSANIDASQDALLKLESLYECNLK